MWHLIWSAVSEVPFGSTCRRRIVIAIVPVHLSSCVVEHFSKFETPVILNARLSLQRSLPFCHFQVRHVRVEQCGHPHWGPLEDHHRVLGLAAFSRTKCGAASLLPLLQSKSWSKGVVLRCSLLLQLHDAMVESNSNLWCRRTALPLVLSVSSPELVALDRHRRSSSKLESPR